MNSVKTNELVAGQFAAHIMDLPNCGGIQVDIQAEVVKVQHCDMWGTLSDTHTTVTLRERGAEEWELKVRTVHNSHTWLVRTLKA